MKSNDKNILNEIKYMVTSEDFASQEKNIFIDGSWGIGKTYFFNNDLKDLFEKNDYEIIYISLFGKKDIDSIRNAFLTKIVERMLNDKSNNTKKLLKKFYSSFKNSSNDLLTNLSKLKNAILNMDLSNILDIYGENLDNFLNKNLVICFDDCERVASQGLLPEFLGILDLLKRNKKIFLISIGNMAKISDENFTAYKEKSFTRFFTLYKSSEDVLKIILDKYKFSETFKESYKKSLTRIFNYKDMHLGKLSSEEKDVYDMSNDIFTNIRILEKISNGIKRLENLLKQHNIFDIYEHAIEYWVSSFFFFGLLANSSHKLKDFSEYEHVLAYFGLEYLNNDTVTFEEIVCARVGDMFLKKESAYLYFKEGYLDELYVLQEATKYKTSKILKKIPDIFSHDFWVTAFYMNQAELLSKRKDIVDFISKNTDTILKDEISIFLKTLAQLEVLSNNEFDDEKVLKRMIDQLEDLNEQSIPEIKEIKERTDCEFINKYYEKLQQFEQILTQYALQKLKRIKNKLLDEAIEQKDFEKIEKMMQQRYNIDATTCEKVTNAMLEVISVPTDNTQLSILNELCKHKEIRELFLEKIENTKKDRKCKIRPEFYEWLIYCFKK